MQSKSISFCQDKEWFAKFKPLVEAFYTEHLDWFYERTFDMEQARRKVASILAGVETRRRSVALLKKRKTRYQRNAICLTNNESMQFWQSNVVVMYA